MPLKGLDLFLKAMAAFPDTAGLAVVSEHKDQFAGSDPSYVLNCKQYAQTLGNVEWTETVTDIDPLFQDGDVLVAPNRIVPGDPVPVESWGRVVEEALWSGIPVIGSDAIPAAVELILDGINGRVVAHWDTAQLQSAMRDARDGNLIA